MLIVLISVERYIAITDPMQAATHAQDFRLAVVSYHMKNAFKPNISLSYFQGSVALELMTGLYGLLYILSISYN